MTANAIEAPASGWHASQRTNLERAVRSAGRHSLFVRVLRVALPVAVVMAIGAYVVLTYYSPMAVLARLPSVSGKLGVQGSKVTMAKAFAKYGKSLDEACLSAFDRALAQVGITGDAGARVSAYFRRATIAQRRYADGAHLVPDGLAIEQP